MATLLIPEHFSLYGETAPVGQGLFINEASRSHLGTTHSVGLLWMSDQTDAETPKWQHTSHKRQTSMSPVRFKPEIPANERDSLEAAATTITQ
jgi:hypothetical protein